MKHTRRMVLDPDQYEKIYFTKNVFYDIIFPMNEISGSHTLRERQEAVAGKLQLVVGLTHSRLINPSLRGSVGDVHASELTYGEITQRSESNFSPDLIRGAIPCADEEVVCNLREGHLAAIDHYLTVGVSAPIPSELAGYNAKELTSVADYFDIDPSEALHPMVEGYSWYRGYLVPTAEQIATLLFTPYMAPSKKEGSPFPIAYTLGDANIADVRAITADFAMHESGSQTI
jgi:hypothetical protein